MSELQWAPWVNVVDFRIVRGATKVHAAMKGWPSTFCHWPYEWPTYSSETGSLGDVTCKRCLVTMQRLGYVRGED